jgi:hypothetical protein
MTVGDTLTIGTGGRKELVAVKRLISISAAPAHGVSIPFRPSGTSPGKVELTTPLRFAHMPDEDVTDRGTGISFTPATGYAHRSGDAVQALGSGIRLERALEKSYSAGTAVLNQLAASGGYRGAVRPDQWYGAPLSPVAGSIALMDAGGSVIVDALVYGSQQSNSSANGIITSPEIAVLEGDQSNGGCIAVVPGSFSGQGQFVPDGGKTDRSIGRFPDGADTDSNCSDFLLQRTVTLATPSVAGTTNIKVVSVAGFSEGQRINIGTGSESETVIIASVGTAGGTGLSDGIEAGVKVIPVTSVKGFNPGQTITIDKSSRNETAVIAAVGAARSRYGGQAASQTDSVIVSAPLKYAHDKGAQVSGTGITLATPLILPHDDGIQVADYLPTPGAPNGYTRK